MASATIHVFVSSTWLDLQPERQAVETALQRMRETKFVGMEYFGSREETPRAVSLDEVARSHLYIGIFGGRYGSGITEDEYRRARELDLPCRIYFKDEATISPEGRETDPSKAARLAALKEELRHAHTIGQEFINPHDLAAKVTADLSRWLLDEYLTPRPTQAAQAGIHNLGDRNITIIGDGNIIGDHNVTSVVKSEGAKSSATVSRESLEQGRTLHELNEQVDRQGVVLAETESIEQAKARLQGGQLNPDQISVALLQIRATRSAMALTSPEAAVWRCYLRNLHPGKSRVIWAKDGMHIWAWGSYDGRGDPQVDYVIKRWVKRLEMAIVDNGALNQKEKEAKPFEAALEDEPKQLLLGEPGAGKTTILEQLSYEIAHRIFFDATDPNTPPEDLKEIEIPIRVELKHYKDETELEGMLARSVNDVLKAQGEALASDDAESTKVLTRWLRHADLRFVLLFDGLNEVKRPFHTAVRGALQSILNYPHRVVISCRKRDYDDSLSNCVPYEIQPLPDHAIETYLQWLLSGKEPAEDQWHRGMQFYQEQISRDPKMRTLAGNPLLLRLMGAIAFADPETRLPDTRARLFEQFVEVMPRLRRREGIDFDVPVPDYKMRLALSRLGFEMHERHKLTADLGDVHEWIPEVGEDFDQALQQAKEWRFLEADGLRGGDVEFLHPLFVEYFAAVHLNRQIRKERDFSGVLENRPFDPHWHEVMLMLANLTEQPIDLTQWVVAQAKEKNDPSAALKAKHIWEAGCDTANPEVRQAVMGVLLAALGMADKLTLTPITAPADCSLAMTQESSDLLDELQSSIAEFGAVAVEPIIQLAVSADWRVRRFAFEVASSIGAPAVEALIALLKNPDEETRLSALRALSRMNLTSPATERIEKEKVGARGSGRAIGMAGTVMVMTKASSEDWKKDFEDSQEDPSHLYNQRTESFLATFDDPIAEVRRAAIDAYVGSRAHRHAVLPKLIKAAGDPDARVRSRAVSALGWNGWEAQQCNWGGHLAVVDPLIRALDDSDEVVRGAAIYALGLVDHPRTLEQLLDLTKHPEAWVRASAAKALGEKGDDLALPKLEQMARDDHEEYILFDGSHYGLPEAKEKVSRVAQQAVQGIKRRYG